ncbi:activating transcription factor of chaperone isoform X2 [Prorops nasuta]|uniref:activating transcription factor of chaperone isoform X2 n=1 Tax=Prorops nasuta TaxID=863751 RepID=UPI0034CE79F4
MAAICYSEPFSDWLEEKIDLPIFEELPSPICGQNKPLVYPGILKTHQQESTQTLLQEFETVLEDVEACHQVPQTCTTLTPPQTPPPNKILNIDTQLLVTLQPVMPLYQLQGQQVTCAVGNDDKSLYLGQVPGQWNTENVPLDPINNDVANELAVVDEFVRSYATDLSPSSPCTSTSAGSCASSEDSIDDPDWILENNKKSSYNTSKNRYKPYSRPSVEDKKVRKKEQNKNAATRYRQKKKQEIKEIIGEERELTDHNEQLQNKVKDLQREIGYLKGLMRDLFKAKGLLK